MPSFTNQGINLYYLDKGAGEAVSSYMNSAVMRDLGIIR